MNAHFAFLNQHSKTLGFTYKARVQIDMLDDLLKSSLDCSGVKIPRAMEAAFLEAPKSVTELRIAKNTRALHAAEIKDAKEVISVQRKRLAAAEKALAGKATKKAQNDHRIANEKIEKAEAKVARIDFNRRSQTAYRSYRPKLWRHL